MVLSDEIYAELNYGLRPHVSIATLPGMASNPDPFYADLEKEMLEKVNKLGIGPQGFGGKTTAIGLNIETLPTHIAGMPCAVNINCHVTRHKSEVI